MCKSEHSSTFTSILRNIRIHHLFLCAGPDGLNKLMEEIFIPIGGLVVIAGLVVCCWKCCKICRNNDNQRERLLGQGGGRAQSSSIRFVNPIG